MQNIDLICVGKLNASYFAAGVAEYQKRLSSFCNFRIIELPEVAIADKNASDKQIAKALQKEGGEHSPFRAKRCLSGGALRGGKADLQ